MFIYISRLDRMYLSSNIFCALCNINRNITFGEILSKKVTIQPKILSISMHIHILVKFYQLVLRIFSGNKNLTSVKGHNSGTNVPKMMCNNPNLDLVNINAHTKFGQILSISS